MIHRLAKPGEFATIRDRLEYLAWYKYRIRSADAADIVQTAIAAYLEVRHRYRGEKNQYGILIGIFNKKCLEYIDGSVRAKRKLERYVNEPRARVENRWLNPEGTGAARGALEEVIKREDGRLILESLSELREEAREMFHLILEEEMSRKALIEHFGLNKNTLDTRLHVYRYELLRILRAKGVLA